MRKFLEGLTEVLTWLLFAIATFLLARQTYFALIGQLPDYSSSEGALIVAGIVTLTWLAMLGRIVLHLDKTMVDWLISLSLLISGIAVDVAVALSFVFEWQFPTHLALLVIVAHVVAHVVQWVVISGQQAAGRFSGSYKSPEQLLAEAELQNVELELRSSTAQAQLDHLQAELDQMKAERERTYETACDVPGCGWQSDPKTSRKSAEYALRAHQGRAHGSSGRIGDNHRGSREREREI